MKHVYALYGGPAGISPTLFGLYHSLPEARRHLPDMQGDEHLLEELFIAKLPIGLPIEEGQIKYYEFPRGINTYPRFPKSQNS